MNLEEMSIVEKINQLESLVSKMNLDVEYSIGVAVNGSKQEFITKAKMIINNARNLFVSGSINNLDMDIRNKAYSDWNNILDDLLKSFPEFNVEKGKSL